MAGPAQGDRAARLRVGVLRDPTTSGAAGQLGAVQGGASLLRVELTALDVREPAAIERNMALLAREPNGGLIVLANPTAAVHLNLIVALAAQRCCRFLALCARSRHCKGQPKSGVKQTFHRRAQPTQMTPGADMQAPFRSFD